MNKEYVAQKAILADVDAGTIPKDQFLTDARNPQERLAGRARQS